MESSDASIGRATALIIISAVGFGSISVLTVLTTGAGVPLLTAMAWRYLLGALLLGAAAQSVTSQSVRKRRVVEIILIGGFWERRVNYIQPVFVRFNFLG